jgi:hypothetical protein
MPWPATEHSSPVKTWLRPPGRWWTLSLRPTTGLAYTAVAGGGQNRLTRSWLHTAAGTTLNPTRHPNDPATSAGDPRMSMTTDWAAGPLSGTLFAIDCACEDSASRHSFEAAGERRHPATDIFPISGTVLVPESSAPRYTRWSSVVYVFGDL